MIGYQYENWKDWMASSSIVVLKAGLLYNRVKCLTWLTTWSKFAPWWRGAALALLAYSLVCLWCFSILALAVVALWFGHIQTVVWPAVF